MGEYVCNDGKPVTISFVTLLQGPTNGDARDVRVDCSAEHLNPQPTTGYRRVSGVSYPAPVEVRKVRIQEMNHPTQVMNLCDVSVKGYETPIKVTSEILRSPHKISYSHKMDNLGSDLYMALETGDWSKVANSLWDYVIVKPLVYILVTIQTFMISQGKTYFFSFL